MLDPFDPTQHARKTDPQTSHEAAHLNPGRRSAMMARCLMVCYEAYPEPLIAEQIYERAEISPKSTPWRRISELKKRALIVVEGSGITSSNARAESFLITPEGMDVVEEKGWAGFEILTPDTPLAGE